MVRIYDCCTISRCIIDMTGGVLEKEGRMLSMAAREALIRTFVVVGYAIVGTAGEGYH